MAQKHSFLAFKGETFKFPTISGMTDSAGNDVSLVGHTLVLVFKDKDKNVLETYPVVVSAMPVSIKIPEAEVETWPIGNNKYVLRDEQPNGDVAILAYGSITVQDVD